MKFCAEKVRTRRIELGLSVAQLAHRLWDHGEEIMPASIYAWEAGICEPKGAHLLALAKALEVEPDYFYTR